MPGNGLDDMPRLRGKLKRDKMPYNWTIDPKQQYTTASLRGYVYLVPVWQYCNWVYCDAYFVGNGVEWRTPGMVAHGYQGGYWTKDLEHTTPAPVAG